MREGWTEADVLGLASEEPDKFDRKSGLLLQKNADDLFNALGKAISAFANSGGGALVLGVEDDGAFSGLDPNVGNATTRDWLEQKVPSLVSYPLVLFRVHTVLPSSPSAIPPGKVLIVLDIGDSPAAPHQNVRDKKYYHRAGGRSEPAPHFYLELLRQRMTNPTLDFDAESFEPVHASAFEGRLYLEAKLRFRVNNLGRVAAYKWALVAKRATVRGEEGRVGTDVFVYTNNFPVHRGRDSGIRIDDTILPGLSLTHDIDVAFLLAPVGSSPRQVSDTVSDTVEGLVLECQLATETAPGERREVRLADLCDTRALTQFVVGSGADE
jgi:hypothetical protein